MSAQKLERLLNLTALLLDASTPVPAEDIQHQIPGYPEERVAFRRAFERDKEELRAMGVPIVVEKVPGRLPELDGYRIPKDQYYLRDPELEPDELAALHLAASAVRVEGLPTEAGLQKLGGAPAAASLGADDLGAVATASLPADPNLPILFGATAERRPVLVTYNGEQRTIDPYRLEYQRGHWYLSGYDHLREEERSYRIDRIEGEVEPSDLPAFEPPTSDAPGAALAPWQLGEDAPVRARVRIDPEQAPWAVQHVGPDNVVEEGDDGSVVIELPVTNRAAFRSFVLSLLDHAEVLEPADLRADLVDWLRSMTGAAGAAR